MQLTTGVVRRALGAADLVRDLVTEHRQKRNVSSYLIRTTCGVILFSRTPNTGTARSWGSKCNREAVIGWGNCFEQGDWLGELEVDEVTRAESTSHCTSVTRLHVVAVAPVDTVNTYTETQWVSRQQLQKTRSPAQHFLPVKSKSLKPLFLLLVTQCRMWTHSFHSSQKMWFFHIRDLHVGKRFRIQKNMTINLMDICWILLGVGSGSLQLLWLQTTWFYVFYQVHKKDFQQNVNKWLTHLTEVTVGAPLWSTVPVSLLHFRLQNTPGNTQMKK